MRTPLRILLGTAMLALLAACGDGGDGAAGQPQPTDAGTVPAQASASVADLIQYLRDLVATSSETAEPLNLGAFDPKTRDDAEPDTL